MLQQLKSQQQVLVGNSTSPQTYPVACTNNTTTSFSGSQPGANNTLISTQSLILNNLISIQRDNQKNGSQNGINGALQQQQLNQQLKRQQQQQQQVVFQQNHLNRQQISSDENQVQNNNNVVVTQFNNSTNYPHNNAR